MATTVYYEFLADATHLCPNMQVIITAGNHDSASRLEAPRPLLARYHVEIRGNIRKVWTNGGNEADEGNGSREPGGHWIYSYDDLIIPVTNDKGEEVIVLAVPFLRSDVVQNASEKIIIGGQEEVDLEGWADHPDYMTCGHIHKRQHIWNTDWARYTGSILIGQRPRKSIKLRHKASGAKGTDAKPHFAAKEQGRGLRESQPGMGQGQEGNGGTGRAIQADTEGRGTRRSRKTAHESQGCRPKSSR